MRVSHKRHSEKWLIHRIRRTGQTCRRSDFRAIANYTGDLALAVLLCGYQKLDRETNDRLERFRKAQTIRSFMEFCCIGERLAAFLQTAPHHA